MDPQLTPPVQLQVTLDDTAGTAAMTWTAYTGDQPFGEYRVQRKIKGMEQWTALDSLGSATQTAYLDTSLEPDTAYEYQVAVVNASGHEALSNKETIAGYTVAPIRLLSAASDPVAGVISLHWARYRGAGFDSYQVRRRVSEMLTDTLLQRIPNVRDTTFVDRSVRADVPYVYTVVVPVLGQDLASNAVERGLRLQPVQIHRTEFSSHTASCTLSWSPYRGPRFSAYRLERMTETTHVTLEEMPDPSDTSHVDTRLRGNTEYTYRVLVLTDRDERVASESVTGSIHPYVTQWPMEGEFVRLRAESGGILAVAASVSNRYGTERVVRFGLDGQILEERVRQRPMQARLSTPSVWQNANGGWTIVDDDIWRTDATGRLPRREVHLIPADDPVVLPPEHAAVAGSLTVHSFRPWPITADLTGYYDSIRVWSRGQLLDAIDLDGPEGQEWAQLQRDDDIQQYVLSADSLRDFRLEMNFSLGVGVNLRIGGNAGSVLVFNLQPWKEGLAWPEGGGVYLASWNGQPPWNDPAQPELWSHPDALIHVQRELPFEAFHRTYLLAIEVRDGRLTASLAQETPHWLADHGERLAALWTDRRQWATCLAAVGDRLLVTGRNVAATIDADGAVAEHTPLSYWVGEIRAWEAGLFYGLGVCQPGAGRLEFGRYSSRSALPWTDIITSPLGPWLEHGVSPLFYPISFDVGPDGRLYVLDADGPRVLVFDSGRKYITEWGGHGSGAGVFDLGRGGRVPGSAEGELGFQGSICVDDEGYIYVADVENQRIQKFAP